MPESPADVSPRIEYELFYRQHGEHLGYGEKNKPSYLEGILIITQFCRYCDVQQKIPLPAQ